MDKNRVQGMKHEIKGAVKEFVGKISGDEVKEAMGAAEKNTGKAQNAAGIAIDKARDAVKQID